jgi:selenide, water dikinase
MAFDLMSTVESGGCSAKLSPALLADLLKDLKLPVNANLLVDTSTHDDAGVYRIGPDQAIILTTDFFPPVCSDPFEFGQIAAANSLSDVYAMGGTVLAVLNLVMFPTTKIPLEVLHEILAGGLDKITEAGAVVAGGHTIDDYPPKYGLAVTGLVHPGRIITNAAAKQGDALVLTKPIGTGVLIAGKRVNEASGAEYRGAIESMKRLNNNGGAVMQEFDVRAATDITGYGLAGHALKMAQASGVTFAIDAAKVPLLAGAEGLADLGCLPGAAFRNLDFVEPDTAFDQTLDYNLKMLMVDAQTSGGLLVCIGKEKADALVGAMKKAEYPATAIIGEVVEKSEKSLIIR